MEMRLVLDVPTLLGMPRLVQTHRLHRWQREPPLKGAAPPGSLHHHTEERSRSTHWGCSLAFTHPWRLCLSSKSIWEHMFELPPQGRQMALLMVHPQVSLQRLPAQERVLPSRLSGPVPQAMITRIPTLDRAQATGSVTVFTCKNGLHLHKLGIEPG